jgi:hypothetical protein
VKNSVPVGDAQNPAFERNACARSGSFNFTVSGYFVDLP